MATVTCAACSAAVAPGAKFCRECGAPQEAPGCPACGAPDSGGAFCSDCGARLPGRAAAAPTAPLAERRVTTVLFGDLVAFTTAAESRDPEEVRELPVPVLRRVPHGDRTLRRHGREVHR